MPPSSGESHTVFMATSQSRSWPRGSFTVTSCRFALMMTRASRSPHGTPERSIWKVRWAGSLHAESGIASPHAVYHETSGMVSAP